MSLFEIAARGDFAALRYEVEYGSQSLYERAPNGDTILHKAVESGNLGMVRYLTEYVNFDPLEANLRGQTPLDLAARCDNPDILAYLEKRIGVNAQRMCHNPVRRGFYPDPSWIRAGQDYYMVNSTFCFFPCIPVSKSRDLVHWTTVGYAVTNPQWARVFRSDGGRGYWAPDISYDPASRRYFITATYRGNETDDEPRCQMITSAEHPEGPYDEPAWIHEDGIDPSIFHDTDGRHYMLLNRCVRMMELSADCRSAVTEPKLIWGGDWKIKTEGPQMMKRDGWYYILAAEGGTGSGHRISAARSRSIWGPYESCPYNPILRQNDEYGYLQNCGHGKLLQTADGRWFLCHLCLRRDNALAPMGRETSIEKVEWTPDGWPIVNRGRKPSAELPLPFAPDEDTEHIPAGLVNWKRQEWLTVRALDDYRVRVQNGALLLQGNGLAFCQKDAQGLLLVRQQEREFAALAQIDLAAFASAACGESAGLTCYYDEHSYLMFGVQKSAGGLCLLFEEYVGQATQSRERLPFAVDEGKLDLRVTAASGKRSFAWRAESGMWRELKAIAEPPYLTSEGLACGKRFTGATVGLYVCGRFVAKFTDWNVCWLRPEEISEV